MLRDDDHAAAHRRRTAGRGGRRQPGVGSSSTRVLGRADGLLAELLDSLRSHVLRPRDGCRCWQDSRHETWGGDRDVPDRPPDQLPLQRAGVPLPQRGPPPSAGHRAPELPEQRARGRAHADQLDASGPTSSATRWSRFAVDGPFDELTVTSTSRCRRVQTTSRCRPPGRPGSAPDLLADDLAPRCWRPGSSASSRRWCPCRSGRARLRRTVVSRRPAPGRAVSELTERIFADFAYDPGFTTVTTPLEEVLRYRRGVCQDFAHLAIGLPPVDGPGRPVRERLPRDRPAARARSG